jgi:hypothetical protein
VHSSERPRRDTATERGLKECERGLRFFTPDGQALPPGVQLDMTEVISLTAWLKTTTVTFARNPVSNWLERCLMIPMTPTSNPGAVTVEPANLLPAG